MTCAVAADDLARCDAPRPTHPRTLVLALDGVPYRVIEQARERGAFEGWPEARRLIAPFPSVTNVSFTHILESFGADPALGYEFQHFDIERNKLSSVNLFKYQENSFAWRDKFDSMGRSLSSHLAVYTIPFRKSKRELADAERVLLASPHEVTLAHVGATDALQHLRGDEQTVEMVLELAAWIPGLRERHAAATGRPLRVVLLSDHGNTVGKVRGIDGIRKRLREAGLDVREHLRGEDDVVAPTFGLVSYGALFLADPARDEQAALALADHPAIDVVAWRSGRHKLHVVSGRERATVRWREADGVELSYTRLRGDPLHLAGAVERLQADGRLDAAGFAADRAWFEASVDGPYPDALHRLVESLAGARVVNRASVVFSVSPGYSWGMKSARWASWLRGGKIEGTHGGLDAPSSYGFLMSTDPAMDPGFAVRAEDALVALADDHLRDLACEGQEALVADDSDASRSRAVTSD